MSDQDLDSIRKDMMNMSLLVNKFDTAIDRLSCLSVSIDKMLAVHETRLENQEKQNEVIHTRINDFKKEISDELKELRAQNSKEHNIVKERLERLEKWRWFVVGAATILGWFLAQLGPMNFFK